MAMAEDGRFDIVVLEDRSELSDRLKGRYAGWVIRTRPLSNWKPGRPRRSPASDRVFVIDCRGGAPWLKPVTWLAAQGHEPALLVDLDLPRDGETVTALKTSSLDFVCAPAGLEEVGLRLERMLRQLTGAETTSMRPVESVQWGNRRRPFSHVVPELRDLDSGRLDARRIAQLLGIPLTVLASVLQRDLSTISRAPAGKSLQDGLATFERIAAALLRLTASTSEAKMWMNAPNPELEGEPPIAVIRKGDAEAVAELLEDMLVGQPA